MKSNNNLKIALLGTRGIPNNYGGFEQFAEYLSVGLVKRGHSVTVYNSREHSFQDNSYKGVNIIHKFCPEKKLGSFAHFIFDWICASDAGKSDFDIIYNAGYQSAAPAIWFYSKKTNSIWVTNMDGLEWKRQKWNKPIQWLTKKMESIAVRYSDCLIADNICIQEYYINCYGAKSHFLAYGADINDQCFEGHLKEYQLTKNNYYLIVARLQPDNSIEVILDGFSESKTGMDFVVVGNNKTRYGEFLKKKYSKDARIRFVGGIYEKEKLDSIRKYAYLYFHGHTAGGTNPSLLEAMAVGANLVAADNKFNKSVLKDGGRYFKRSDDITKYINSANTFDDEKFRIRCMDLIKKNYNWDLIIDKHEQYFMELINN